MSRSRMQLHLALPVNEALNACQSAADALGWRVLEKHSAGLTAMQIRATPPIATGNPATICASLGRAPDGTARVELKASNFGCGALQTGHVKECLQHFRAAIQHAIADCSSTPRARPGLTAIARRPRAP